MSASIDISPTPANPVVVARLHGRIRVEIGGYRLAESEAVLEVFELGRDPVMYFPGDSVRRDRLHRSDTLTHCPRKGDASYWSIEVGSCSVRDAVWSYERPLPRVAELAGYVAFRSDAVDAFDEEGQRRLGPANADCR